MKNIGDIIIKPLISEKSFAEAANNKYSFVVRRSATKTDVKNAVEKIFGVKVLGVFTANIKGSKTRNTRFSRKIIDTTYKKAGVQLKKGEKLEIFEESTKDEDKKKSREAEKNKKTVE